MTILNELTLASGEITLLALLCLVLVIDLFVSQEKRLSLIHISEPTRPY